MAKPSSPLAVFGITVVLGGLVALLTIGFFPQEHQIPWTDLVRDVVYERQAVDAALNVNVDLPDGHARTPGGIVVVLPLAVVDPDYLTALMSAISVLSLGLIAAGAVRVRRPPTWAGLLLALCLPVSVPFIQAVFHGSTFLPIAACLVWMWVFAETKPILSGALLAVAGVARLWPLLLLVVLIRRGQRTALTSCLSVMALLTLLGLALPGISLSGSLGALIDGGQDWIGAQHNGSLASWMGVLGQEWAAGLGLVCALAGWAFGLVRSKSVDGDVAWTLPLAILASPLAWLPYLLAVVPVLLIQGRSKVLPWLLGAITFLQLVGYRAVTQQVAMTATLALVIALCWVEWVIPPESRDTDRVTSKLGAQAAKDFIEAADSTSRHANG